MIYLPSSLAAGQFTDRTSHLPLRTSHQAIHHASNPLDPVPHHPFALPSAHLSDRTSHFSLRYSNHCVLRPCHLDRACLPLLASLFALPSSLLGADPFLYHTALLGPNHCLLQPCHLDRACLSLLASFCALPSSLLGTDPFRAHPASPEAPLRTCHFEP